MQTRAGKWLQPLWIRVKMVKSLNFDIQRDLAEVRLFYVKLRYDAAEILIFLDLTLNLKVKDDDGLTENR